MNGDAHISNFGLFGTPQRDIVLDLNEQRLEFCRRVMKVDHTITKCPSNPLGIKGCGEAGAIAAPAAVINAITDAIGTEDLAMPATPQAVWTALPKAAKMQQAAE